MRALNFSSRWATAVAVGIMSLGSFTSPAADFDQEGIVVNNIKYGIIGTQAPYSAYVVETDMFDDDFEYEGAMEIPETIEFAPGKTATVIGIEDRAFYSTSVTSVTLPNSVSYIGKQAFGLCSQLNSMTLGSGVTAIGSKAFFPDAKLTTIFCNAAVPPTIAPDALMNNPGNATLYVPANSLEAYKEADVWKSFGTILSQKEFVTVTDVIVTPSSANVSVMGTVKLTATVLPAEAEQKVSWMSSNQSVATVSVNGEVFGVKDGICTVTAYATDGSGVKGECVVTVGVGKQLKLSVPYISGYPGDRFYIEAAVSPDDTTVEWDIDNTDVATLTADGLSATVKLVGNGNATLKATASNGLSKEVEINVMNFIALTEITVNPSEIECEVGDIISIMEFNVQPVPEDASVFDPEISIEDDTVLNYDPDDIDMQNFICLSNGTTRLVWSQGDITGYCTVTVITPSVGIDSIAEDTVRHDDRIFSIDGSIIDGSVDTLLPGLYIVNGKKVVKK